MKETASNQPSATLYGFFYIFLFLTGFLFVSIGATFFSDPVIHRFESYQRLQNWDLRQHGTGDYDGDGQNDFITFTGCAFLSSSNLEAIPTEQKCTATGIFSNPSMSGNQLSQPIGQKYITTDISDLILSNQRRKISHSYLGKSNNEDWKIFVRSDKGLQVFVIGKNGILSEEKSINLTHKIDNFLYILSSWAVFIIIFFYIPFTIGAALLLSPLKSLGLLPTKFGDEIYGFIVLLSITIILYGVIKIKKSRAKQ